MSEHTLHYGDISWTMPMADKNLAAVLESNPVSLPVMEPDQAVREALRHPIGSPCLKDIVSPGEKICLLVPDVTRLWQSPAVYVHVMVEELNACGIPDSDILIVTATGTHRAHVGDEQARLLGEDVARKVQETTLAIYEAGRTYAASRGIIVADTKFEFGFVDGELRLIDEVLTPDSSRFWPADQYEPGHSQPSFDKQYLRDWLSAQPWDMQPPAPALPDEVVDATARRYREAYHILTGKEFTI